MPEPKAGTAEGQGAPPQRTADLGRRRFIGQLAGCLVCLTARISAAGDEALSEPQRVVQQVSDGVRRVLRDDRQLLETDPAYVHRLVDELLLPNVDFQRVCSIALGPFWKQASPTQRDAFSTEFKALLINTYATLVNELSDWEIRYLPLRLEPGETETVVRTQVLYPGGEPVDVDYRMHLKGSRWLAYDVTVAGISLLANYRSSFVRMAQQKGIDGLIDELAARNAMRKGDS